MIYETTSETGKVSNAPRTQRSAGYSFVMVPCGREVYVSAPLTEAAGITYDNINQDARVTYYVTKEEKAVATKVSLVEIDTDLQIANAISRAFDHMDEIDELLQSIVAALEARGVPFTYEDEDGTE